MQNYIYLVKTPSYILLYIAPCKIYSIYYFFSHYNSNVKFYPIWSVLLMYYGVLGIVRFLRSWNGIIPC